MKKRMYIILVLLLPSIAWSQTCLENGLILETQAQIDSFSINHPNCTEVLGDLHITNFFDELNLSPLSQIHEIKGDLRIHCKVINGLNGFENLESVGDTLFISSLNLAEVDALSNLQYIGGEIQINAKELVSINGLSALDSVGSTIFLNVPKLISLDGLQNLEYINNRFRINTESLQNLNGLNNLKAIRGSFELSGGDTSQLASFDGLDSLKAINGNFIVQGFPLLKKFNGFPELDAIENMIISGTYIENFDGLQVLPKEINTIRITSNSKLTSFEGLSSIEKVKGGFHIKRNANLNSMSGLVRLNEVRELLFEDNASLVNLEGLENLTRVGDLRFTENKNLESLEGLTNLESIYSGFYIYKNGKLKDFHGLEQLDTLNTILTIRSSGIQNLKGLESITTIPTLCFWGNEQLLNLQGADNLKKVVYLDIRDNDKLEDLQGIENLEVVNYMRIARNDNLVTLDGIENINPDSIFHANTFGQASIMLFDNPQLKVCDQHPICTALEKVETLDSIRTNQVNCNSRQEILEQCLVSSIEEHMEQAYQVTPNPAVDIVYITAPRSTQAILYDSNGQVVSVIHLSNGNNTINLTDLKKGMYILSFDNQHYKKIIKM